MKKSILFVIFCTSNISYISASDYSLLLMLAQGAIGKKVCLDDITKAFPFIPATTNSTLIAKIASMLCLYNFQAFSSGDEYGATGELAYGTKKVPIIMTIKTKPEGKDITFAIDDDDFSFSTLFPELTPLNKLVKVKHTAITIVGSYNTKQAANIEFDLDFGQAMGGEGKLRLHIGIPRGAGTLDNIEINLSQIGEKPTTLCLAKPLEESTGENISVARKILGDLCFTCEHGSVGFQDKNVILELTGTLQVFGKKSEGLLYISFGVNTQYIVIAKSIDSFELGRISQNFSSVDSVVSLAHPTIIIATHKSRAAENMVGEVKPGISIRADIEFKSYVGKLSDAFDVNKTEAEISIPLDPTHIQELELRVKKTLPTPIKYGPLAIKDVELHIQGDTPLPIGGLGFSAEFATDKEILYIDFGGSINPKKFDLNGSVRCKIVDSKKTCPVIHNPFGFPFTLTDPAFKIHVTAGSLSGLGLSGKVILGKSDLTVDADIDIADPFNSRGDAKTKQLCFTDVGLLWLNILNTAGKKVSLPSLDIPAIGCLKDTTLHFTFLSKLPIVSLDATLDVLGYTALCTGSINPLGISLTGDLDPIQIPGLFAMTAQDNPKAGPSFTLDLNLLHQEGKISGTISLLNGLIKQNRFIDISPDQLKLDVDDKLFGFGTHLTLTLPFDQGKASFGQWRVHGEITSDLSGQIRDKFNNYLAPIKHSITEAENKCNSLPPVLKQTCTGAVKGIELTTEGIDKIKNLLAKPLEQLINTFAIKKISFDSSLAELETGKLPAVAIDIVALGNNHHIQLARIDLKNPNSFIEEISSAVLSKAGLKDKLDNSTQMIEKIASDLQKIDSQIDEVIEEMEHLDTTIGNSPMENLDALLDTSITLEE